MVLKTMLSHSIHRHLYMFTLPRILLLQWRHTEPQILECATYGKMNNFQMAISWKILILDTCSFYFNDQTTMKKISKTITVRKKSWE